MKAIWNNQIIAESEETIIVENNHYFPHSALKEQFFSKSKHHTTCPWKGKASYYTITVDGKVNENAAWYYPQISEKAKSIENSVAFWKGVEVID